MILKLGSRGNEVRKLQENLGIRADGVYGRQTQQAVANFQRRNRITTDGIAGPETLSRIYGRDGNIIRLGSRGDNVANIQRKLGITADGVYGRRTQQAVINFQKRNKIRADGVVGPQTLSKLNTITIPTTPTPTPPISVIREPQNFKSTGSRARRIESARLVVDTYRKNGTRYNQARRQFGLGAKYADCSSAVTTMLQVAGQTEMLKSQNSRSMKREIETRSRNNKLRKNNPISGDIMLWGGHVAIVVEVKSGELTLAHMGVSGPRYGTIKLQARQTLREEKIWGSGGFLGFWTPEA